MRTIASGLNPTLTLPLERGGTIEAVSVFGVDSGGAFTREMAADRDAGGPEGFPAAAVRAPTHVPATAMRSPEFMSVWAWPTLRGFQPGCGEQPWAGKTYAGTIKAR